ncbi:YjjW family glycine radical enzyme activase [Fonticella tunisiensis]|uniref:Pyruvate formate lyase activating enzyme n=1 Tax=Fonticella tunisiensis TaxID=1096341 RepID=A0A4R7KV36_9CLOT|nr:YjjW family glycine radical enzyme activase [Fonticella tunisiensis]TDT63351.1 pyruvate formate lyase activating enzyme [Fonticella tunisiensis]
MENKAVVNRIIPFSNVDGPGNRLAIFFQGCNISCIYCHNPETINRCISCMACVSGCPSGALKTCDEGVIYDEKVCTECDRCIKTCRYNSSPRAKIYTVDELYKIIDDYKLFIRGITVSGGEPTLQAEFITELFKRVKPLGLTCFVDTNGFFDRERISGLIEAADKFMVDIKAIDNIDILCGTTMKNNIENLKYLLRLNKVYEVRSVIIQDYMDVENTLFTVASILKEYPEVIYKLIRVHTQGLRDEQKEKVKDKVPSAEYVRQLGEKIRDIGVRKVELII